MKRWGYSSYRTFGKQIQNINLFQLANGYRYTLVLTDTDLIRVEVASGKTYSFVTPTYVTGTISAFNAGPSPAAKTVVTGSGTDWVTAGIAAGDMFIMTNDLTADEEPDTNWVSIKSRDSLTQITLDSAYTGSTATGDYIIRKVFTLPAGDRWSIAQVNDCFYFGNGNTDVHYYTGSGYAVPVDTTNASRARFMIEYGDRLCIADLYDSTTRMPYTFRWSKNGDPTNWTDSTAGEIDLLETEAYINGLGKVGSSVVVYKPDSMLFGSRTGVSTDPFTFPLSREGVGCVAPYSIVDFMGTNAFIGRDDFYYINGDMPESIGFNIRNKFFDIVGETEVENTVGTHNSLLKEIIWMVNTTEGRFGFVFNYKYKEWYLYEFADDVTTIGRGVA